MLRFDFLRKKPYLLIPLVLLLIPIIYSVFRICNPTYWDGAFGNWLATMMGVIGGIPIALELDRFISSKQEKKQQHIEKEREKRLLELINEELQFDLSRLEERKKNTNSLPMHPFKVDFWEAVCDSGEIKYINSFPLLNRITSAYHIIKIVKRIEEKCHESSRGATVHFGNNTTGFQLLLADARAFDKQNTDNTEFALSEIKKYLGK